jgi:cell division protein YceG involved in septum cleavage
MKVGGVLFLVLISLVSLFFLLSLAVSSNATLSDFVVNQGDGIISISSRLEKNKLIKSKYVFILHAYKMGLNSRLQAGSFQLSASLSTPEIITKLSSGGKKSIG